MASEDNIYMDTVFDVFVPSEPHHFVQHLHRYIKQKLFIDNEL